ncbi:MAG: hypothetical protein ISQ61_01115 [SAR86 cluster bacterium]|uniref:Uncharacterized protein n=1 Tax=SAR86 cluster bacterium TaxID=2030880 RepID=A0A937IET9_9GAMM|nr:hypothetical protein [SAR86 cluster bacterium]
MNDNIKSALIIGSLVGGAILLNGQLTKEEYPDHAMHMKNHEILMNMMKPGMKNHELIIDDIELDENIEWNSEDGKKIKIVKKTSGDVDSLKSDAKVLMFKTDKKLDISDIDSFDINEIEQIIVQSIEDGSDIAENLKDIEIIKSFENVNVEVNETVDIDTKDGKKVQVKVMVTKKAEQD